MTQRVTDEQARQDAEGNYGRFSAIAADLLDTRTEIAALRAKLKALRLVDTLARNSTDMTKIREAEKAAYACGAIEEEKP